VLPFKYPDYFKLANATFTLESRWLQDRGVIHLRAVESFCFEADNNNTFKMIGQGEPGKEEEFWQIFDKNFDNTPKAAKLSLVEIPGDLSDKIKCDPLTPGYWPSVELEEKHREEASAAGQPGGQH
jgi:hypothetical protein